MLKSLSYILVLLLAIILLAACGSSDSKQTKSTQNEQPPSEKQVQKEIVNVKVAVPFDGELFDIGPPIFVAQEKGYFKDEGIAVDLLFSQGGGDTVQTTISGSTDIGIGTGVSGVMGAYLKGAPIRIIASEITGLDVFYYVKGDSTIQKLTDLAGAKLGYSRPGSSTHLTVLAAAKELEKQGLKSPQAEAIGGPPDQYTAVMTEQIDAGWATPPYYFQELKDGKIRVVFRGSELEEYRDVTMRVQIANTNFLKEQPEAAKAFLKALNRGVDFIFDNPSEAIDIWIKGAKLEQSPEVLKQTFDFYNREMLRMQVSGIEKSNAEAVEFGFLDNPLSETQLKELVETQYLPN